MTIPTQDDICQALEELILSGHLVAYRDEEGATRFATASFAEEHNLTGLALHIDKVRAQLAAHKAEMMGEWN